MQKFIVPQFIDVESKIIGPITTRQFVITLVGLLFGFIAYKLSDFTLFFLEAIIIFVIVAAFAFVKVNAAPFHVFLLNFLKTSFAPNLRVWKREKWQATAKKEEDKKEDEPEHPPRRRLTASRLSELALIIDTGGAYSGEDIINSQSQDNEK
ncbi:MAG: PrgI family protein [Candidatus Komeilibacteria bacterium]